MIFNFYKRGKMRIPIIAGNWKMNKTISEATNLASSLRKKLSGTKGVKIVLCPPYTALAAVGKEIEGSTLFLGAQNVHWEKKGAYTGEISCEMLLAAGCKYVIIGHSERRIHFSETNQMINTKVKLCLETGLLPIVCVGEKLGQRLANKTFGIVEDQVKGALKGLNSTDMENVAIAYEPVWAIGTGRNATPEQAVEVHVFIRDMLSQIFTREKAEMINILYGGSVTPENSKELLAQSEIDGALVGGASLDADSFERIVKNATS